MKFDSFLEKFFGPGNEISLDRLVAGDYGERGEALIEWVRRVRERSPSVLPRARDHDLVWYGIAFEEASAQIQRAELRAWLGPSFTDFAGLPAFDPQDDIERAVDTFTGGNWVRLHVPPGMKEKVRETLELMRRVDAERPRETSAIHMPTGRLLRDFQWALRRQDAEESKKILSALEASGQISAINVSYLRVQRLSQLGLSHDLLILADLSDVVATRRPRKVTEAITKALYSEHMAPALATGDYESAVNAFTDHVAGRFNALFGAPSPLSGVEELQMQMAWATLPPQKPTLRDELLSIAEDRAIDDDFLSWLSHRISPPAGERAAIDLIEDAVRSGAFASALTRLRRMRDGMRHAQLALRCAFETDDPDDAAFALGLLGELSEPEQRFLQESRTGRLWIESLRAAVGRPDSWLGLLQAVNSGQVTAGGLSILDDQIGRWRPQQLIESADLVVDALLEDRQPAQDAFMRSLLPTLVQAIDDAAPGSGDPRVRSLLTAIGMLLMVADGRSEGDLETLLDLAESLLGGASSAEHHQLVMDLLEVWKEEESRRRLPWLIDLAELVAGSPRHDSDAAASLGAALVDAVARRHGQMNTSELGVSLEVLSEMGISTEGLVCREKLEDETGEASAPLGIRKVGVYTLTPGVGQRAARVLESQYPDLEVVVNSDTVSSEALVALSKNCDVMIVVTRSATHAATEAIHGARPHDKPILYSPGKGSSSLIAVFEEYAASLASAA